VKTLILAKRNCYQNVKFLKSGGPHFNIKITFRVLALQKNYNFLINLLNNDIAVIVLLEVVAALEISYFLSCINSVLLIYDV
jgi:hypothetical protein